jgi:hypothetical protein
MVRVRAAASALLLSFVLGACASEAEELPPIEERAQALLDAWPEGFTQINAQRVPMSAHNMTFVDTWVLDAYVAEYEKIIPLPEEGSGAQMPPGAAVIKVSYDADDNRVGGTMLYKGEAGYNDTFGDWFSAEVTPDLAFGMNGRIQYCVDCHEGRPNDDYLWGIALDNRN